MDFQQLLNSITPDVYQNLKTAIELGKWPTGVALTQEQTQTCMQAVIAYEQQHVPENERTGVINDKCASSKPEDDIQTLTVK